MVYRSTSNLAVDLGKVGFESAYRLQKQLVQLIRDGNPHGFLLFLEHDPVYTIGRKPVAENYSSVDAIVTERGGDVTYHGPGQQVVYPILNIARGDELDVRDFVHFVEDTVISILGSHGYRAKVGDEPGIWVSTEHGDKKVASIGMAIDHGICYHGVSINISAEPLNGFRRIRPCGLDPAVMHYVDVTRGSIMEGFVKSFSGRFGNFEKADRDTFLKELSFTL